MFNLGDTRYVGKVFLNSIEAYRQLILSFLSVIFCVLVMLFSIRDVYYNLPIFNNNWW